jgi:hypothetical protein
MLEHIVAYEGMGDEDGSRCLIEGMISSQLRFLLMD